METADTATPLLAHAFPEAATVGAGLRASRMTVAVAESCTGGLLGAALTAVPGSSHYVRGGVIAYADDVKREQLGIDATLLEVEGAVSERIAAEMAVGIRRVLSADIGLAITGVAGPDSPGSTKPVGLCFVAVAGPMDRQRVIRLEEDRGREANRASAVREALRLCLWAIGQDR